MNDNNNNAAYLQNNNNNNNNNNNGNKVNNNDIRGYNNTDKNNHRLNIMTSSSDGDGKDYDEDTVMVSIISEEKLDLNLILIDNYDSYTYNLFSYLASVPLAVAKDEFSFWSDILEYYSTRLLPLSIGSLFSPSTA